MREGFELSAPSIGRTTWLAHLYDPSNIIRCCAVLVPRIQTSVCGVIDEHCHRRPRRHADFIDVSLSLKGDKKLACVRHRRVVVAVEELEGVHQGVVARPGKMHSFMWLEGGASWTPPHCWTTLSCSRSLTLSSRNRHICVSRSLPLVLGGARYG